MSDKKKSFDSKILIIVLLLLFLLGGGYYIAIYSTDSARQVGAGKDYDKWAENSEMYDSKVNTSDSDDAFFDKNDISLMQNSDKTEEDMNKALLHANAREEAKENLSKGSSLQMASSVAAERMDNSNASFSSGGKSMTVSGEDGTEGEELTMGGSGTQYKRSGGILDDLKRALYLSDAAVKDLSAEGASDKLSDIFDPHQSLSALGVTTDGGGTSATEINDLNALPKFLREQEDFNKISVVGSKVAAAGQGEYDMDPDKAKIADNAREPSALDKTVGRMFPGMMNPIFMGILPKYEIPERSPYEIAYSNLANGRPGDLPSMMAIDDENLIVYGSKQGFQIVYDMQGNFVGCMDNASMIFKAAGTPGCPR